MDFRRCLIKRENLLLLAVGLVIVTLPRFLLISFISWDMYADFQNWYKAIAQYRGLPALAHDFSNYPPFYLLMLVLVYYINQLIQAPPIIMIKSIPIIFDFYAAYWVYKIVGIKVTKKAARFVIAVAFLSLPTVFINSSMWGQIESIFTSFILASLYYLLQQRNTQAMVYLGLAFSIKLQSIFFAPFLLLLLLFRRLSVRNLLLVPGIYLLSIVPAWLLGRPFGELLEIYPNQVVLFSKLSFNAPTLYAFFNDSDSYLINNIGVVLAIGITLIAVFGIYRLRPRLSADVMLSLAATSLLLSVYLLPRMHERYFYPAEVFFLVAGIFRPKWLWVAAALQFTGLSTYSSFLLGTTYLPLTLASLINLAVLVYVSLDVGRLVIQNKEPSNNNITQGLT